MRNSTKIYDYNVINQIISQFVVLSISNVRETSVDSSLIRFVYDP